MLCPPPQVGNKVQPDMNYVDSVICSASCAAFSSSSFRYFLRLFLAALSDRFFLKPPTMAVRL